MTDTTSAEKMAPCPFCGGDAEVSGFDGQWYARCRDPDCFGGTHGAHYIERTDAVAAWNTCRQPGGDVAGLVEELRSDAREPRDVTAREAPAPTEGEMKNGYRLGWYWLHVNRESDGYHGWRCVYWTGTAFTTPGICWCEADAVGDATRYATLGPYLGVAPLPAAPQPKEG